MLIKRFILLVDSLLRLSRASTFKNSTEKEYYAPSDQMATGRIYGGRNANIEDNPWMVSLLFKNSDGWSRSHRCGGTIVAEDAVLTAEHCKPAFANWQEILMAPCLPSRHIWVAVGTKHQSCSSCDNVQIFEVSEWIGHKDFLYISTTNYVVNDIALLKIKGRFTFNRFVQIIKMSTFTGAFWSDLENCKVTGWGETGDWWDVDLKEADSIILGGEPCTSKTREMYMRYLSAPGVLEEIKEKISDDKLSALASLSGGDRHKEIELVVNFKMGNFNLHGKVCTTPVGTSPFEGICKGDSGGPLVCRKKGNETPYLIGIAINVQEKIEKELGRGEIHCTSIKLDGAPATYTNVGSYKEWIYEMLKRPRKNCDKYSKKTKSMKTAMTKHVSVDDVILAIKAATANTTYHNDEQQAHQANQARRLEQKLTWAVACLVCWIGYILAFN